MWLKYQRSSTWTNVTFPKWPFYFIIVIGRESNKIFRLITDRAVRLALPRGCLRMARGLGRATSRPKSF